tara:strand:+ start:4572 stop:5762 length:1191 start_codon:yes stop_codon:yes gene_type:complete
MDDISKSAIDVEDTVDWLVDGVRSVKVSEDILRELVERLTGAGLPLYRVAVFVTTLHPNVAGRGFFWREGEDVVVAEAPYEVLDSDQYYNNPIYAVFLEGKEIRRKICDPDCPNDFLILDELREEGVTDYIAMPLDFTNGENHCASYSTRQVGGFTDAEIAAVERIRPALTRVAEIFALKRTAMNLLDAYLGHQAGMKVLTGQIKRGDGQEIHAVIWFCDLRNSTPLADSMSREAFLSLLNDYFECLAGAVLDHEGEVLRFIGDAALAIFPVTDDGWSVDEACEAAASAAKDALGRMVELNNQRESFGAPPLGFGIGLHLGDVMYGNIGTAERIEFTVIGAAANEAARIEGLCKTLDVNFLISEQVREHLKGKWQSLGKHALRGVGDEIEVFTVKS